MRVLLYYNHEQTLGHSNRTIALACQLKQDGHETLVINGGQPQDFLSYFNVNIRVLPSPKTGRKNFYAKNSYVIGEDGLTQRINAFRTIIDEFNPDIFVTEFFPFGRMGDRSLLLPIISYVKKLNKSAKIIGSIGYPMISDLAKRVISQSTFYDKILIHTPNGLDNKYVEKLYGFFKDGVHLLNNHYNVFDTLKDKICYTGYIINKFKKTNNASNPNDINISGRPNSNLSNQLNLKNRIFVLVSRGGGVFYPGIILKAILAKKYLEKQGYNIVLVAVTGPATSDKESILFNKIALKSPDVIFKTFIPNFIDYLSLCDMSLSMAGYNTSVELLWLKKKCIVFPIETKGRFADLEQAYRGILLKKHLNASVLDVRKATPKEIAEHIKLQLSSTEKANVNDDWFNGLKNSVKELVGP